MRKSYTVKFLCAALCAFLLLSLVPTTAEMSIRRANYTWAAVIIFAAAAVSVILALRVVTRSGDEPDLI